MGPSHGASLADLDAAAGLIQRVAKPALNSVEVRLQGLNEPEVQGLRQTAEADEGGIGTTVTAAVATAAEQAKAAGRSPQWYTHTKRTTLTHRDL